MRATLVLSCEHGGKRVPARHRALFRGASRALESHRGWDRGALTLARELARALDAPLFACTTTRLLVDTNRSLHHRHLFSEWTRHLPADERAAILDRWWTPHRAALEHVVQEQAKAGLPVLHLSVHSFTPRLHGRRREVDVGVLYDPGRRRERAFSARWLRVLGAHEGGLVLRRNQPYRGTADGHTSALRRRFSEERYLGLELEVSQRFPEGCDLIWRRLRRALAASLREALEPGRPARGTRLPHER